VILNATHLEAHRADASPLEKGLSPPCPANQGLPDREASRGVPCRGKPWIFLITENQVGDYRGANAMLPDLPEAGAPMPS
jgi:hypothetical protein